MIFNAAVLSYHHLCNPFAFPFNPLRPGVLLVLGEAEGDEAAFIHTVGGEVAGGLVMTVVP